MGISDGFSRKEFLIGMLVSAASTALPSGVGQQGATAPQPSDITLDDLKAFEKIAGLEFSEEERKRVLNQVIAARRGFENVRGQPIDYSVLPQTPFFAEPPLPLGHCKISYQAEDAKGLVVPTNEEDIAFMSVRNLSTLIKQKKISPVELTKIYLKRLDKYGDKLLCVVTMCEDLALKQAKKAEEEIMRGGPRTALHGIPYGIKDLFATKDIPTTWGASPYKSQVFDYDSAVVERMNAAGAVMLAKLSMGALAMGDVWFKGTTKNPWNVAQGSSGSSAGSACATAAGLAAFCIGTETLGSIVSPSHQCRVTGLRPTFGRISRYGAMAVSWSMDKAGPICRTVEDCALVLGHLIGADPRDPSAVNRPFEYSDRLDVSKLRIGYLLGPTQDPKDASLGKEDYLLPLIQMGAKLEPIQFAPVPEGVSVILGVEAAAAFDDLTRSPGINDLKPSSWPETYRANRHVPAVEYLQAMRARTLLMKAFNDRFVGFDMFVAKNRADFTLLHTNLTGHPQILVPDGVNDRGNAKSVSFVGQLFDEGRLAAVASKYQKATGVWKLRPDMSKVV